jgi:hypothetical protein
MIKIYGNTSLEDLRKWIDSANQVQRRMQERPDYSDIFNGKIPQKCPRLIYTVYDSRTSSPVLLKDTLRGKVNFLQATVDTMYQSKYQIFPVPPQKFSRPSKFFSL